MTETVIRDHMKPSFISHSSFPISKLLILKHVHLAYHVHHLGSSEFNSDNCTPPMITSGLYQCKSYALYPLTTLFLYSLSPTWHQIRFSQDSIFILYFLQKEGVLAYQVLQHVRTANSHLHPTATLKSPSQDFPTQTMAIFFKRAKSSENLCKLCLEISFTYYLFLDFQLNILKNQL